MSHFHIRLLGCLFVFPMLLAAHWQSAAGGQEAPAPPVQAAQPAVKPALSAEELARRKELLATRVTELYELYKIAAWRKAEAYFTEDSRDTYYGTRKDPILSFELKDLQLHRDGTRAIAALEITCSVDRFPAPMRLSQKSRWVWERDSWYQKLEPFVSHPLTPFVVSLPADQQTSSMLRFEKSQAEIGRGLEKHVFRFQNVGKETITVRLMPDDWLCMSVSTDKEKYAPGEWGEARVETELEPDTKAREFVVQVLILPGPQWAVIKLRLP